MTSYAGYEIRIVDGGGRPVEAILADQTFYVELLVPDGWKDPGNRVELDFTTSSGGPTGWGDSEDLDINWTERWEGDSWLFMSTPVTVSGGAEGGADISVAGFSTSWDDMEGLWYDDGATLTVRFVHEGYDGTETPVEGTVRVFSSVSTLALDRIGQLIDRADEVFPEALTIIAETREQLTEYPDSPAKREADNALDTMEADIERRQQFLEGARAAHGRDDWVPASKAAVAAMYLRYLQMDASQLAEVRLQDVYRNERATKETSDDEVRGVVDRYLGEATLGAYQLFAQTTLAAQITTLLGPLYGHETNEMGKKVGWDERTVALLDLISEAAFTGAGMRFELNHLTTTTAPRLIAPGVINGLDVRLGAAEGGVGNVGLFRPQMPERPAGMTDVQWDGVRARFDQRMGEWNGTIGARVRRLEADGQLTIEDGVVKRRVSGDDGTERLDPVARMDDVWSPEPSRFQGDDIAEAVTGDVLAPEQAGMVKQAADEASAIAARPREGLPNGVMIWTRPSNLDGIRWRELGHAPKGIDIKSKTINAIDVQLGARPGSEGLVGFFTPELPPRGSMSDAEWAAIEKRFNDRNTEQNSSTGDHMRGLAERGDIRFENGVVINTGLYETGQGKGITGDYDLFEITDLDGNPVPPHIAHQIVEELKLAPAFEALHGAHMRWLELDSFRDPKKVAENLRIFQGVVLKHASGGEEPLIVFSGGRAAFAVWSDQLPPRHFAEIETPVGVSGARNLSSTGVYVYGLSPIVPTAEDDGDWEEHWDDIIDSSVTMSEWSTLYHEPETDDLDEVLREGSGGPGTGGESAWWEAAWVRWAIGGAVAVVIALIVMLSINGGDSLSDPPATEPDSTAGALAAPEPEPTVAAASPPATTAAAAVVSPVTEPPVSTAATVPPTTLPTNVEPAITFAFEEAFGGESELGPVGVYPLADGELWLGAEGPPGWWFGQCTMFLIGTPPTEPGGIRGGVHSIAVVEDGTCPGFVVPDDAERLEAGASGWCSSETTLGFRIEGGRDTPYGQFLVLVIGSGVEAQPVTANFEIEGADDFIVQLQANAAEFDDPVAAICADERETAGA